MLPKILFLPAMQQPLALVGMPGSGKTFWAKKIAAHLYIPCYDLDDLIVKETGLSIGKIFKEFGEAVFRKIETDTLKQLLQNPLKENFVLALGGGTPAFFDNMHAINRSCISVYLNLTVGEIIKNIGEDNEQHRPLVKNTTPEELKKLLTKLLKDREDFYKMADYMLYANELSITNFEKIILDAHD